MSKFFFGAMWSACSVSGAALVHGWARGSAAGWEML
jgi:hypothetical protein